MEGFGEAAAEPRVFAEDLDETDDPGFLDPVGDGGREGVHFRAAEPVDGDVRDERAEFGDETGAVAVAAAFAGDEEAGHEGRGEDSMSLVISRARARAAVASWPPTLGWRPLRAQLAKAASSSLRGSSFSMRTSSVEMPEGESRWMRPSWAW